LRYDKIKLSSWFKTLYQFEKPSKGVYGYSIGFQYLRFFNDKFGISLGGFSSKRGQKSPFFLVEEDDVVYVSYKFELKSFEFPLEAHFLVWTKDKMSLYAIGGVSVDIYQYFKARDYLKDRITGEERIGCCTQGLFQVITSPVKKIYHHAAKGLIRIGFILGSTFEYSIIRNIKMNAQPELRYYSNVINSFATVIEGTTFSVGINLGVDLAF